jgi:hypothetical protein
VRKDSNGDDYSDPEGDEIPYIEENVMKTRTEIYVPQYIGCFEDKDERDLKKLVGTANNQNKG